MLVGGARARFVSRHGKRDAWFTIRRRSRAKIAWANHCRRAYSKTLSQRVPPRGRPPSVHRSIPFGGSFYCTRFCKTSAARSTRRVNQFVRGVRYNKTYYRVRVRQFQGHGWTALHGPLLPSSTYRLFTNSVCRSISHNPTFVSYNPVIAIDDLQVGPESPTAMLWLDTRRTQVYRIQGVPP